MLGRPGFATAERLLLPINDTFMAVNIPPWERGICTRVDITSLPARSRRIAMDDMVQTPARMADVADPWLPVPHRFRHAHEPLPRAWDALYGPLRAGSVDDLMVVAQLGQSIDGRITTDGRHPTYINGAAGLDHLHRLRALVDAVVVGVGTAISDDPQLTVRRVAGPNPARDRDRPARTARRHGKAAAAGWGAAHHHHRPCAARQPLPTASR